MPDWLLSTESVATIPWSSVATRLLLAWGAGVIVASFTRMRRRESADDTLPSTLILMSVLIAMATQIIGDNVARAFSLVGALSIVRFRSAVPSTQDVALVLAAVVVGMAIGAGQYTVSGLGLAIVGTAIYCASRTAASPSFRNPRPLSRLTLQVTPGGHAACLEPLRRMCDHFELVATKTLGKGAAMSFQYRVTLRANILPEQAIEEFAGIAVVESVAWKSQ